MEEEERRARSAAKSTRLISIATNSKQLSSRVAKGMRAELRGEWEGGEEGQKNREKRKTQ